MSTTESILAETRAAELSPWFAEPPATVVAAVPNRWEADDVPAWCTSGTLLVSLKAMSSADAAALKRRPAVDGRRWGDASMREVFDAAVAGCTLPLDPLGVRTHADGTRLLYLAHADTPFVTRAAAASYLRRVTRADRFLGSAPHRPILVCRGPEPVAVVMPCNDTEPVDPDTARRHIRRASLPGPLRPKRR